MDVFIGPSALALALTFFARRLFVGWKAGEFSKGNGEMLSKTCFRSRKRSEHAILFIYLFILGEDVCDRISRVHDTVERWLMCESFQYIYIYIY